jgi:molybdopterin-binding protein
MRFDTGAETFEAPRSKGFRLWPFVLMGTKRTGLCHFHGPGIAVRGSRNKETRGIHMASKLSARNQIEGRIVEYEADGVMAHVTVQVGKNLIESVITRRSAEEMKLKVGDRVKAVIKSTEVMLQKG